MLKRAIIAVAVLAVAAPGLAAAKGKKVADTAEETSGPIPYSQLAEVDAKMNGPVHKQHMAKHHMAKKEAAKPAQ